MRIAVVDASDDTPDTERALAVALARAPARLFLFRAAADVGARLALQDMDSLDDRFLDLAASWLLEGSPGEAPLRASLPVPILEIAIAIADGDHSPLVTTKRALELLGDKLCMAVPRLAQVPPEEHDNAHLWIAGGSDEPQLRELHGRAAVIPGDVLASGGGITLVDSSNAGVTITRVDFEGRALEAKSVRFATAGSRLLIQGGSR